MKINLRQAGKLVCRLEVLDHGALVIRIGGKDLELSSKDSRRLAGAIAEKSISGAIGKARGDIRRQARQQLEQLLGPEDE